MQTTEEIEGFLIALELQYEKLDDNMWVVYDESHPENIVIYRTDTILNFRVKLFDLAENQDPALYRTLLELNAKEMLHGAYAIEEEAVVIVGALEVENIDDNEFQAVIDSFSLAISTHYEMLKDDIQKDA